ncbi:MAG: hypothetical protein JWO08_16, partial [Verrucomicrobiaceae bacterium]|nr:hypothetical protein [Verrucomicrobiaceae bacterium]
MSSYPHTSLRRHSLSRLGRGLGIAVLSMVAWLILGQGQTFAQTYNISSVTGTTVTTTAGSFNDSGGAGGSYSNSETYTVSFKSGTANKLRFIFNSFSTESGFDYLYIYDGTSVASPQILGSPFSGTTSPSTITSTSSSLTFKFVSDGGLTSSGWAAAISSIVAADYGDYSGFGSASTTASTTLFMGTAATDAEASSAANSTGTGDPDDEDLTQPALIAGATASLSVPVFNNTGSNAYLSIWIDYNNNGVLTNTGDQVVNNLTVSSNSVPQTLVLSVAVPSTATTGTPLGIRYRLDSITGTASTGIGGIGEVEDYLVTISPPTLDYGDFSGFGNAASTANSTLRLGLLADAEGTPVKNSAATGDDITGSDDEDGIVLPSFLTAGLAGAVTGTVTNNTGANAYLNAWIDYNNNGSLADAGEQIVTNSLIPTGVTNFSGQITFTVPSNATTTTVGMRFRLSSTSSPGPTGTSGAGEVEDYVVPIQPSMTIGNCVWNDVNNNGVKDAGELGIGGAGVQLYSSGADNTVNTTDDVLTAAVTTGVSGTYLFSGLPSGKYFVKVTPPTAYPATGGTPITADNDVDNNNDGSQPGGPATAVYSPIITLTANGESVADGDTDANTNLTVDFGLFSGFTVGNLVFTDTNNNGV